MAGHYALEISGDLCTYLLSGDFDARSARALQHSAEHELPACRHLVVDLRGLRACHPGARSLLVGVHTTWASRAERIAYLATEARFRGLSLWIMHMAGDENAKAVGSQAQVTRWLGAREGRQEQAFRTLVGSNNTPPIRPRRIRVSHAEQAATQAASWAMQILLGYRPPWFDELVRTHGFLGLRRWTDAVQSAVSALTERHGDFKAQTLLGLCAFWNGCTYCSRGHLLASNLLYFESTNRLFPLPETEVMRWRRTDDDQVLREFEQHLGGEFDDLRDLVRLQFHIKMGAAPNGDATARILHETEAAWALVSECSITDDGHTMPPPLHPRLARDRELLEHYHQARTAACATPA